MKSGLPRDTEFNRNILLQMGVPAAAIELFGAGNRNTADEAFALKEWAEQNEPSVLILPTEIFTARRVRWIFNHEFSRSGVRIEVPSFEPKSYTRADWWTTTHGLSAFGSEVLKYGYYRLKY
jgi:hypothetical protein